MQQKFLKTLFEPGELTCFSNNPYAVDPAAAPAPTDLFFCINPLHGPRCDANVSSFRNFLIEIDSLPLNQQVPLVTSILPVTSIVYSGGKSYHFIISLQTPAKDEAEYRRIGRGLLEAVPEADKSTKNPSRFSRLPGVIRPDTGLLQELVYVGERVPVSALPTPKPYHEPKPERADILFVTKQLHEALSNPDQYMHGRFSGRNQFFYWVGKRLSELGHTREQKKAVVEKFYSKLQSKRDFSIREAYAAARVKF